MRKILLAFFAVMSPNAGAQISTTAVLGVGSSHQLASCGGFYNMQIIELSGIKLNAQAGGRLSYLSGQKRIYQTGNTKDRIDFGIEKLEIKGTSHLALNSAVGFEITSLPWNLGAGFNIDVFGYGYSPTKSKDGVSLTGTGMNSLRNAYNDIGTLYSEMYVSKRLDASRLGLKLGTSHAVTQYRATDDLGNFRTRRFLNFSDSWIFGLSHDY